MKRERISPFWVDGYLPFSATMRVVDHCQNNNDFKLTVNNVKRLEMIAKPRRNTTEEYNIKEMLKESRCLHWNTSDFLCQSNR